MSSIICFKCGGQTNTAVSDWIEPIRSDGKANRCYAKWENNKWVEGCAYKEADSFTKYFVDKLIKPPEKV